MDASNVPIVQQSLGRCLLNNTAGKSFLDAFYDEFLSSDPRLVPMFSKTEMEKQKQLLRQGLTMLVMFAKGSPLATSAVKQLALKHDHSHLNIDPGMYRLWVKSLLTCIERYDPTFDAALRVLWKETLDPGIQAMKQAY